MNEHLSKVTMSALNGSILKWEKIFRGLDQDNGTENCPLCQLFYGNDCLNCPIANDTGAQYCEETPHTDYALTVHEEYEYGQSYTVINYPELKPLAFKELRYLIRLKRKLQYAK